MDFGSWDIAFCRGQGESCKDGVDIIAKCPVKEKCHRYWTEWHTQEALRTNDKYHSFIIPSADNITKDGCNYFWENE